MIVKLKYVGTGIEDAEAGHCTFNAVYTAISIFTSGSLRAVIVDDNGALYAAQGVNNPLWWELVSVTHPGEVQVYP